MSAVVRSRWLLVGVPGVCAIGNGFKFVRDSMGVGGAGALSLPLSLFVFPLSASGEDVFSFGSGLTGGDFGGVVAVTLAAVENAPLNLRITASSASTRLRKSGVGGIPADEEV